MALKTRVTSNKIERFTIWDNFARHDAELRALGATDADLATLRAAAEAVDVEEQAHAQAVGQNPNLDHATIPELTAPVPCANGWLVNPPTLVAKRWAMTAVMRVTGGREPTDPVAVIYSVLAGLWVLYAWGNGRKDEVMQTVTASGRLAELLPDLSETIDPGYADDLADDYMVLMGFTEKKSPTHQHYRATRRQIRSKLSAPSTTPSSPDSSPPAAADSASPGTTSNPESETDSSAL